jgi:GDP/UDP-N,N'-diacetylbacillosamine 2-epimerase (hydrolysing)
MIKLSTFTASRSEYGLLKNLVFKLSKSKKIKLNLIVSGSHLIKKFGNTVSEIKSDKIKISKKIRFKLPNASISLKNLSENSSNLIVDLSRHLIRNQPNAIILLGDRYETFAAATAAVLSNIKIIHIHGGEVTYGSRDDLYRHAISKMANYHFVSTEMYKKRLIQLGEQKKHIHRVGALCNDNINNLKNYSVKFIEKKLKTKLYKKNVLVSFHPNTKSKKKNLKEINKLFYILATYKDCKYFFSFPNADKNSEDIIKKIKLFCKKNKNSYFKVSFGSELFLNIMKKCNLLIGNSSSGIIEAPLLGIPSINIGDRQKGRIKSKLTIDTEIDSKKIFKLMNKILNQKKMKINFKKNPYYGKNVSDMIFKKIIKINYSNPNHKNFYDLKFK